MLEKFFGIVGIYLQAKYFKIYIDEYQDCDKSMHKFFMYLCDELNIETFVVGDEKQSIYIWRGAYPEAFKSIWNKPNFKKIFMGDNFRSCQQIQNYSNLLCDETRSLYNPTENIDNIVWLSPTKANWATEVLSNIVPDKKSALLRFSNDNARIGASELTTNGLEYVYIPQTPIADITTDTAWLYTAIAKYLIIEKYSAYDVISEIPVEGNESRKTVSTVKRLLKRIEETIDDEQSFGLCVTALAEYLGYDTRPEHIDKLFKTISDTSFHVAFEADKYKHIAITFHSSKGLEFEQVIVFAGTTEGRQLSAWLAAAGVETLCSVATEYGELLVEKQPHLSVHQGRLLPEEMEQLFAEEGKPLVLDVTHPYAVAVSANIKAACEKAGCEYLRLIRPSLMNKNACKTAEEIVVVESVEAAVNFLKTTEGSIFVTTGSKELAKFTALPDYQNRVYARVLATPEVVTQCTEAGFTGPHLICMQGPFSKELNLAMLRSIGAAWMVTKEAGRAGGFEEK